MHPYVCPAAVWECHFVKSIYSTMVSQHQSINHSDPAASCQEVLCLWGWDFWEWHPCTTVQLNQLSYAWCIKADWWKWFILGRFTVMKFKSVTFEDSVFKNCLFQDVTSLNTYFRNCTFVDTNFSNTGMLKGKSLSLSNYCGLISQSLLVRNTIAVKATHFSDVTQNRDSSTSWSRNHFFTFRKLPAVLTRFS